MKLTARTAALLVRLSWEYGDAVVQGSAADCDVAEAALQAACAAACRAAGLDPAAGTELAILVSDVLMVLSEPDSDLEQLVTDAATALQYAAHTTKALQAPAPAAA